MASGVQDRGGERKRAGPVTLEPVWASRKRHPRKASPKEEEEVSRGQREIRSREPERPSEHALWEAASVRVRAEKRERGRLWRFQVRVLPPQWFWRDAVGWDGREEFQWPGLSEC